MKEQFDFLIMAPELFVAGMSVLLLLAGLFLSKSWSGFIQWSAVFVLGAGIFLLGKLGTTWNFAFHDMFVDDAFARMSKILVLASGMGALIMARPYQRAQQMTQFEYPVLVLFATIGMMLMISAHDMLALYVGLELQSLTLYVLAAFQRDDAKASEAGMKYFVLGALSSGLLLFGISLIYGLAGTTNFTALQLYFGQQHMAGEAYVALVFIMAALAFKVSAAPFHMWTPDVYEGAPTPVTAFFATAPKIAALALLTRVLYEPLHGMGHEWQQILTFLAIASMLIGGFAAIVQTSIKRLLAYSSISHVGYALVGLASGSGEGVQGVLVYLSIYFLNTLGVFAVVLSMRHKGQMLEKITDLAGLSRQRPMLAFSLTLLLFSLAGVPPLAGFYGKFYVFLSAWHSGLYPLVIIGLLTSAVAAYYYLRLIVLMYFDDKAIAQLDPVPELSLRAVMLLAVVVMLGFGLMPTIVIDAAQTASMGLFNHP
jgi:NADH-quinone oxidoreductase subunit N